MQAQFNGRRQWRKLSFPIIFLNTVMFAVSVSRRKTVLLVGISKTLPQDRSREGKPFKPLNGPRQDVSNMKTLLLDKYHVHKDNITVMVDEDDIDPSLLPTRENILREIGKLTKNCQPGDEFIFYYAGHSDQRKNEDNTEEDGLDELIVTLDGGRILDDDLNRLMIEPLKPNTSLIAILDTCHAQSLLDLYHYRCNRVQGLLHRKRRIHRAFSEKYAKYKSNSPPSGPSNDHPMVVARCATMTSVARGVAPIAQYCGGLCHRAAAYDKPYVLCISACKDGQTASDNPKLTMTSALVEFLWEANNPTLKDLMRGVSLKMRNKNIHAFETFQRDLRRWRAAGHQSSHHQNSIVASIKLKLGSVMPGWMMKAPPSEPQLSSLTPLFMNRLFSL
ncbi:caspase domain-containing protein [Flagelloscypha sp. PMI_526]|nr:caspase domain-containing protein [Flagelloscypha sp. PMI_526]